MSSLPTGRILWHTPNFLSADVIRELSEVSEAATIGMILVDLTAIVLAAAISEAINHPIAYVLAVVAIAGRLHNLGALGVHEGAHYRLARNKRLNDFIANFGLTPLVLFDMPAYRKSHLIHHQFVGQDGDTEKGIELPTEPSKSSAILLALGIVAGLLGLVSLSLFLMLLRERPIKGLIALIAISGILFGAYSGVVVCVFLLKYWLVPFATWLGVIVFLRGILEHLRVPSTHALFNENRVFLTRTVRTSWFDSLFVIPIGLNYHLEHHLYPSVPCYRLHRLHALLMRNDDYRRQALITRGYFRTTVGLIMELWRGAMATVSRQATAVH
jgi:fatty acid desaturase